MFVHGFLLGARRRKMSKSLGNVLDPFEVIDAASAPTRCASTCFARSRSARTAPSRSTASAALRDRARERVRQPRQPHDHDARRYRDGAVPAVALDPELAAEFEGLAERVGELLDRAELTTALELIWQRVRRLNRYVEERAPWQLARDPADAGALDETLASLAEGLRVMTVLLHAYMPASTRAARALGGARPAYAARELAATGGGRRVEPACRRCSRSAAMIDSHTHLRPLRAARRRARRRRRARPA